MTLSGVLTVVSTDPAIEAIRSSVGAESLTVSGPAALRPLAIAALASQSGQTVLAVTSTGQEAEELIESLQCLLPPDSVAGYPGWETLPHERLSPRADTVGLRLAVLRRLRHPTADDGATGPLKVVVAPVRSILQPQVPGLGDLEPVSLKIGDSGRELDEIVTALVDAGYARTELVASRGEFAVRGGILDVFPPTEEHPLRVEFWGDTVEEIRYFKVADQRSVELAPNGLWAPPCREVMLTDDVRKRAAALLVEHPELGELLEPISQGIHVEGMEALAPVLVDELRLVLEEFPGGTHVLLCDPERIRSRAADLVSTSEEFLAASWAAAAGGGKAPVDLGAASLRSIEEVRDTASSLGLPWWNLTSFTADSEIASEQGQIAVASSLEAAPSYRGDTESVLTDIGLGTRRLADRGGLRRSRHRRAWRRAAGRRRPAGPTGAGHRRARARGGAGVDRPPGGRPDLRAVEACAAQRIGSDRAARIDHAGQVPDAVAAAQGHRPDAWSAGDYVVHEQHGVGRYVEMVQRTVNGGEREYLIIEYGPAKRGQPGDRLFVPTDPLDQVTKYVGGEAPTLHKLGGADWAKTKGRARKAVREIAAELIRLYSARMASPGYAFGPDTPWQRELEDAFPTSRPRTSWPPSTRSRPTWRSRCRWTG